MCNAVKKVKAYWCYKCDMAFEQPCKIQVPEVQTQDSERHRNKGTILSEYHIFISEGQETGQWDTDRQKHLKQQEMKFKSGQTVICVSGNSEWDYLLPNFDEQLKIALKVNKIPIKDREYIISDAQVLLHKGRTYLSLVGFDHNIFDEKGFSGIQELISTESIEVLAKKAMLIKLVT